MKAVAEFLLLCTLLFSSLGAQRPSQKPCDDDLNFCWYGPYSDGSDEMSVWGTRWVPQGTSEKSLDVGTSIRCIKRLSTCIKAGAPLISGKMVTNIELMPVTR